MPWPIELDALEWAWTIIANARDWNADDEQGRKWRETAIKWRDEVWYPSLEDQDES